MSRHDRSASHRGFDSSSNIRIAVPVAGVAVGQTLDLALAALSGGAAGAVHREVVMGDAGSGVGPILAPNGDWVYGHVKGA